MVLANPALSIVFMRYSNSARPSPPIEFDRFYSYINHNIGLMHCIASHRDRLKSWVAEALG